MSLPDSPHLIPVAKLGFPASEKCGVFTQPIFVGKVPDVITDCIAMVGPAKFAEPATSDHDVVWIFIDGKAVFSTQGEKFPVQDEAIAHAPVGWPAEIAVPAGEKLLAIRIRKKLSADDRAELANRPPADNAVYFKRFADCPAYTEPIKSPKTVSRTVLPEGIVPRMAAGTVYTTGPDQVGRHKHPMLEQMFVGLKENNSVVTADDTRAAFPPFSILHIPLGSMHGAEVAEGSTLHYIWIDYFATKEGQEWLKTHKPIAETAPTPAK